MRLELSGPVIVINTRHSTYDDMTRLYEKSDVQESEEFHREIEKVKNLLYPFKIIAVGNPGSGKSTILNCLASEILFTSGISIDGTGLTFELVYKKNKNGEFFDTPGLADREKREAAGKAISKGLQQA